MIDWSSIASLVDLLARIVGTKSLNLECRTFSYNRMSVNHHQIHLCVFRSISDCSGVDGDIPALAPLLPCVLASFNFDTSVLSQWSSEAKLNWIEKDWQTNENTHNLQKYWLSGYSYVYRKKAFCLHLIDNKMPVLLSVQFFQMTLPLFKQSLSSRVTPCAGQQLTKLKIKLKRLEGLIELVHVLDWAEHLCDESNRNQKW